MKKAFAALLFASASAVYAVDIPVQRVADDAKAIDRVAEAAKRDLPQQLLQRILNDDIEWLRGKRSDGTYDYATFERLEASRSTSSYSVEARKDDDTSRFEVKGAFVYRLNIEMPSRRMLVTKNRHVYIDRVEIEYIPMNNSSTKSQTVKVGAWLDPGQVKAVDFPEVARQATVRVYAKGDPKAGYGNIDLTLIRAKVIDNADSPYADAVASAKAIQRAVDNNDIPSIRAMAVRMYDDLASKIPPVEIVGARQAAATSTVTGTAPSATVEVRATPPSMGAQAAPNAEVYAELQTIEDLLTGSETEKRAGLERLHQLVRKMRPR